MVDLLAGLNPQQKKAVQTTEGPLLVRAGAGSGKTRVLTRRIVYLIQNKHVPSYRILALTFTNKAANEMSKRINELLGTQKNHVWASTFHALGIYILRQYAYILGYRNSFTIASPSVQKTTTKHVIQKDNKPTQTYKPKDIKAKISDMKNNLITPKMLAEHLVYSVKHHVTVQPDEFLFAKFYKQYQQALKRNYKMDFDDLIMLPVLVFKKDPKVLHQFQDKFKYISVDEYQDTNHAQYVMVKLLADKFHNICAVGDENQSIYGWRGADISNILDFKKDYPHAKEIFMEENYRSNGNTLYAADSVIANNYKSFKKKQRPWTNKHLGHKVVVAHCRNPKTESLFIAHQIKHLIKEDHYSYNDFAVLYRANALSRQIQETFFRQNIPNQVVGGGGFLERKEIRDMISYLSVLVNPSDSISLERIINEPKRGIGRGTMEKLVQFASKYHTNELHAIALLKTKPSKLGNAPKRHLTAFYDLIQYFRSICHRVPLEKLIKIVIQKTGYYPKLKAITTYKPNSQQARRANNRLQNLSELVTMGAQYDQDNKSIPVSKRLLSFLSYIQLQTSQDKIKNGKQVTLMTVHAAKGLEYPVVFMIGMENGIFPSTDNDMADMIQGPGDVSHEERRVCYVGMTRAEKRLYMTFDTVRSVFGSKQYQTPSEFLNEIDKKYVKYIEPDATMDDIFGSDEMF